MVMLKISHIHLTAIWSPLLHGIIFLLLEISIPQLWTALEGDANNVSHISLLPTTSRHVIIQCKVCKCQVHVENFCQSDLCLFLKSHKCSKEWFLKCFQVKNGQQALMEKNGTRLQDWRLKVELWFEFCFHMTRRNVLLIENVDQGNFSVNLPSSSSLSLTPCYKWKINFRYISG